MLKFEVESLDGVEESVRGLYEKRGDKYRLKVEGIDPADELKEALRKEREDRKTAKERVEELERAQRDAEEERQREKGEFKTLYEREQQAKKELADKFAEFQTKVQRQEISLEAQRLAGQLSKDRDRSELLAEKVAQLAKHTDAGVRFEIGGVEVEHDKVLAHLKSKYPFLVDASGVTGGGASLSATTAGP